ncbi:MAG: Glucose 1-dehydrogenase 2 [Lentisphaerae bacterium ADurb.Bin242]|nr:MAG: Glucose 1-dehydrogenase 2 [Lentisphaerae bacterium ADurb.Bin242]
MDLSGKKAAVTGAGRRIGSALARAFAARGARLALHYNRSEKGALALLEELGGTRAGHAVFQCDLADLPALRKTAPEFLKDASVLVNNASIFLRRTLGSETSEEAEKQFAINFTAPVELMRIFAACCGESPVIINMLDQGICRPDPASFSYALSKKALADATRAAALQLAPRIRVNGIAPGPVLPPPELPFSTMEKTLRSVPLGKPVSLDDLCAGAVFLAENESMTGAILYIDGGQSLGKPSVS